MPYKMPTRNLYKLHAARRVRLRVHYPDHLDRLVLRTELDWGKDILPADIDWACSFAEFDVDIAQLVRPRKERVRS